MMKLSDLFTPSRSESNNKVADGDLLAAESLKSPAALRVVTLNTLHDKQQCVLPRNAFGVQFVPREDSRFVDVHPSCCHACHFNNLVRCIKTSNGTLTADGEAFDDGVGDDHDHHDDDEHVIDAHLYPSDDDLLDLEDRLLDKFASGKRACRPKKNQGDRSSVARANIPRRSKHSRNGGRIKARNKDKLESQYEKYRRRPSMVHRSADSEGASGQQHDRVDRIAQWRMDRSQAKRLAHGRFARQPRVCPVKPEAAPSFDFPDVAAAAPPRGGPVLSAEELGMDRETWELLLQLQHREINPNDYNVLLELDNTIEKPALDKKKLRLFPVAVVQRCEDNSVVVVDDRRIEHTVVADACLVCLGSFAPHESVRKLPCGHVYHTECIDAWFEQSTKCPTDQTEPDTPLGSPVGFGFGRMPFDDYVVLQQEEEEAGIPSEDKANKKQILGELLLPLVAEMQPDRSGKITEMLLDLDDKMITNLINDGASLKLMVDECLRALGVNQQR
jgi:hypothetical protein